MATGSDYTGNYYSAMNTLITLHHMCSLGDCMYTWTSECGLSQCNCLSKWWVCVSTCTSVLERIESFRASCMTLKISSWLNDCTEAPCVSTATYTLQVGMYLQINVHAHYTSFHTTVCTNGQCILGCRLACMNCSMCWNRTSLTLTMWQCVAMKFCTKVDPCGTYSHYPTIRCRYTWSWIKVSFL